MEQFTIVSQQLFVFAAYFCLGIVCIKFKIFDKASLNALSKFIINITIPATILCNILSGPDRNDLITALPIFVIYLASFLLLFFLNFMIVKLFRFETKKENIYKALATFSNAGFMGIPLILSLFKERGAILMSLCMVIDQVMLWTLGVKLTSNTKISTSQNLKKFINPALISIFISLLGVSLNFKVPVSLQLLLKPVGAMTPVLSLLYIGGLCCYSDIKKYFNCFEIYMIIIFKMIIFPVTIWFTLQHCPIPTDIIKTVVLLTSLPSMTSIAILAKKYENHDEYAIAVVLITTLASLVTVPLVSLFVK